MVQAAKMTPRKIGRQCMQSLGNYLSIGMQYVQRGHWLIRCGDLQQRYGSRKRVMVQATKKYYTCNVW